MNEARGDHEAGVNLGSEGVKGEWRGMGRRGRIRSWGFPFHVP